MDEAILRKYASRVGTTWQNHDVATAIRYAIEKWRLGNHAGDRQSNDVYS